MATKTHVILPGSRRPKDPLARRVGPVDPKQIFDVTIGLAGPEMPSPEEYVGQRLTPAKLAEKFGTPKRVADKVAKVLRGFGLRVDAVMLGSRSMRVSGTAAAMEAAFKPRMAMMRSSAQGEYRGRDSALYIPNELKGLITGIFGLDERKMVRDNSAHRSGSKRPLAPLGPADVERLYHFPPGTGARQKVAIAEFGGGYFAEDLAAYCKKYERPVPHVQPIAVDAPAYTLAEILAHPRKQRKAELDDSFEVMMDVEIAAGLCPKADIAVYFSAFDQGGWVNLLDKVIQARPTVLAVSWGLAEEDPGWSKNAIEAINDRLNAARLLGITVCVASGDDGSGDQMSDAKAHVDFPSSSPHALGVGGTKLVRSGGKTQEVAWWERPGRRTRNGGGATGGGVSTHFDRPAWQTVYIDSLNRNGIDGRVTPDVAALAGNPGYGLIVRGKPYLGGGTSASTPLWAALIARINALLPARRRQRFLTPLLYQCGKGKQEVGKLCIIDITRGNNASHPKPGKGYKAGPGFDAVTGWGVPNGVKLREQLAAI